MKSTHTHPMAEKLQVKFHHQDSNPGDARDVKKTISIFHDKSDLAKLQQDFRMREEGYDLKREFEIQYEQFLTNISGHSSKNTRS